MTRNESDIPNGGPIKAKDWAKGAVIEDHLLGLVKALARLQARRDADRAALAEKHKVRTETPTG